MQLIESATLGKVFSALGVILSGDDRPYGTIPELGLARKSIEDFLVQNINDNGQVMILDTEEGFNGPLQQLLRAVCQPVDQAPLVSWSEDQLPDLMGYGSVSVYPDPDGNPLVLALSVAGSPLSSASTIYLVVG